MSNYDSVDTYVSSLGMKASASGLGSLSHDEQLIVIAYSALSHIQNGGFLYFYQLYSQADLLAEAFERLGFTEAAEAVLQTMLSFPNGVPSPDDVARNSFLELHGNELETHWLPFDRIVWAISWEELDKRTSERLLRRT